MLTLFKIRTGPGAIHTFERISAGKDRKKNFCVSPLSFVKIGEIRVKLGHVLPDVWNAWHELECATLRDWFVGGVTRTVMSNGFCKFPQTRFWLEVRQHLLTLSGVAVTDANDVPVVGSWIDFTFRGHSFTINAESGEFVFFVEDTDCPESVRAEVAAHFESFLVPRP